jgi:iron complex outermembrane receptor protein
VEVTAPIPGAGTPIPFYVIVSGNPDYLTEELLAFEAGYRVQVGEDLSFDFAVFNNDYDHLQTQEVGVPFVVTTPLPYLVLPVVLDNGMEGDTYGGTFVANWQPLERWRFRFNYSRLQFDLRLKATSTDTNSLNIAGNSPRNQVGVYAIAELPRGLSLYSGARYVDDLPNQSVDSYLAIDMNLDWRPSGTLTASLSLLNVNDRRHIEFGGGTFLERSAHLRLAWTF